MQVVLTVNHLTLLLKQQHFVYSRDAIMKSMHITTYCQLDAAVVDIFLDIVVKKWKNDGAHDESKLIGGARSRVAHHASWSCEPSRSPPPTSRSNGFLQTPRPLPTRHNMVGILNER